ncbi:MULTISPECIES: SDR family NAD(P)-dependent oxidoreductase [unclassified Duganella]|uniref:SDR family NAD(P)-dependent oxidoreductase n=1 Tax=unclassified Duganella TaxID=2636909 RepID=UPI000886EFFE|nr:MULTISPECIES: SDR family NAD(P)-dependent oxidoreductase [unclassified Duganella]SDF74672.1 Short-chain dehydrogenase [Duganella sp. OV458]SDI54837.1 Short-chain dehydrogenase [Duganella sp. OV510]
MQPLNTPIRDWAGLRVWVIGASSGIGAALAQEALQAGARVALSARRAERLQTVAAGHPQALVAAFDILDKPAWRQRHDEICTQFGGIDLTIFCAADYRPERSWEIDAESAAHTLATNLGSVYTGLTTVLPDMLARGSGGIAIVASVAGYFGLPNASVYGPSKAALINLAELLYVDLRPRGISVYLINPGFVQTPLTAKNEFTMPALQTPQAAARAIRDGIASGRFEIHFPRRFTLALKLLRWLPYRLRFPLISRLVRT